MQNNVHMVHIKPDVSIADGRGAPSAMAEEDPLFMYFVYSQSDN